MPHQSVSPRLHKRRFLADNGLTIALFSLFLVFFCGQAISGLAAYNQTQHAHHLANLTLWKYLRTGNFLDGVLENWQAAILQLASLILFGTYLDQRGAAHSKDPDHPHKSKSDAASKNTAKSTNARRSRHTQQPGWIKSHSLSLALILIFLAFFTGHLLAGAAAYRSQLLLEHQQPLSIAAFAVSAKFWFLTFQTWEAEFFAIALYVVLTIFLRQQGSPESKPVNASNRTTGETDG